MRIKAEKLENGKMRLEVALTSTETEEALRESRASVIEQLDLKVDELHPAEKLAKEQYDIDNFDAVVAVQMVETLLPAAIDQAGVVPAFLPEAQQNQLPKAGCSYSFSFVVTPKPAFELSFYGPVEVEVEPVQITDDQVRQVLVDIALRCCESSGEDQVQPDYSDEWIEEHLPFELSLEETKSTIREELMLSAKEKQKQVVRKAAVAELAKRFEGEIPAEVLEAARSSVLEEVNMALAQQGVDARDYFMGQEDVLNAHVSQRAYNVLAQGYTLDAVFKHAQLKLEKEDIDAWCATVASGQEASVVRKKMQQMGQGFLMREGAQRLKAGNWLADQAIVTERELS
ncbi:hypothetical protein GMI69_10140 [Eggerthellaceae bacterium zg-887]|uniref:trigger factor n=1 Tax=Xiamenia xianingshaonis TaxID=2682776 RepID=UPI00140B29A6|nr:trigger factor [Xiamenia xianingshaonis]NHM16994.1 hypothetical protein [Xiamenia xianingshaonis]